MASDRANTVCINFDEIHVTAIHVILSSQCQLLVDVQIIMVAVKCSAFQFPPMKQDPRVVVQQESLLKKTTAAILVSNWGCLARARPSPVSL